MSDYDLSRERLVLQIARERIGALIEECTASMKHIPAGSRIAGKLGDLKLGAVTIPESKPSVSITDPAAFTAWVKQSWPHEMKDTIRPEYLSSPQVVALVKEHFPDMVDQVTSPQFTAEVTSIVLAHGGFHDGNGEIRPVPGVVRDPGGKAGTPMTLLEKDIKAAAKNPALPLDGVIAGAVGREILSLPPAGTVTAVPDREMGRQEAIAAHGGDFGSMGVQEVDY